MTRITLLSSPSLLRAIPLRRAALGALLWLGAGCSEAGPPDTSGAVSTNASVPAESGAGLGPVGGPVVTLAAPGEPSAEADAGDAPGLLADIRVHTAAEVADVLARLEAVATNGEGFPAHSSPVIMVLHGDEAETFTVDNYSRYRDAVDRAARLQAWGVLDIRICERWMRARGVTPGDLPRFVGTVPDGPEAQRRLERSGYLRF